ncbi:hypothetical protein OH77DRAFT_1561893 [Trametes cingulata]|nr:hypothetical protein OH77DRAFT_1561893 [Trametes cingulata]
MRARVLSIYIRCWPVSSLRDVAPRPAQSLIVHDIGRACDVNGNFANHCQSGPCADAQPSTPSESDWSPYNSRLQFEVAHLLYAQEQMGAANIDRLLELWNASLLHHGESAPFANHVDLYRTIDSTPLGDVRWQCFSMQYPRDEVPPDDPPAWMTDTHEVWYRDPRLIVRHMLANPDFRSQLDYAPFREFADDGTRRLKHLMSGDWAWRQADELGKRAENAGAGFVSIILGSDKTTVSVATGQNEYYPLYLSIGNLHNSARRAHRNGVVLVAFLAIPKATARKDKDDVNFRKFRRQLFHASLSRILDSFKPYMEHPEIVRCSDGNYRKVIYGLGPYIADYPEQALLSCIVQGWCPSCRASNKNLDAADPGRRSRQHTDMVVDGYELGELWDRYGIPFTNDFPRADIHELIAPDILHQLIKGTFKDHLVTWVELYIC